MKKTWYSKTKGWVEEKPDDWRIPKKTSNGTDVFIGDSVRVYHHGKAGISIQKIVETKDGHYGYKNRPYDNASLDAWSDLYPTKTINKNK